MRLVALAEHFLPEIGGAGVYLHSLLSKLPAWRTIVLAPKDPGAENFDRQVSYRILRSCVWGILRHSPLRTRPLFSRLFKLVILGCILIRGFPYRKDLWLVGLLTPLGMAVSILHRVFHTRFIVVSLGEDLRMYQRTERSLSILRALLRDAERVITISQCWIPELSSLRGRQEGIVWIPPTVDLERFHPDPGANDESLKSRYELHGKKVLLTVSRLAVRKGIDSVLSCLLEIVPAYPNLRYVIVGKGEDESRLKALATDLQLQQYVLFMGAVPDEILPSLYRIADIFVMPNREMPSTGEIEGFGIVFLEASASGIPVIGGNSGGAAEAIQDGKIGFLVAPGNEALLQEKILQLLSSSQTARYMGLMGRRWVKENFSPTMMAQRFLSLLEQLGFSFDQERDSDNK
jgi:phosphatidylinositol alpha-1,6-mannosyltransferase